MTFPPLDLLAAVVARRAAHFAGLDRLRVDARRARSFLPTEGLTNPATQRVDELLPGAVGVPGGEVIPDRALGEQIVRQVVPLTTRAVLIEQRVDDFAHGRGSGPAARFGGRDQGFEDLPLLVGQVGGIALAHGFSASRFSWQDPSRRTCLTYGKFPFPDSL